MATIKDLTKAILELKSQLKALEAENTRLKADNDMLVMITKQILEEIVVLQNKTDKRIEGLSTEIETLKAERVIVSETGELDTGMMALQALDRVTEKFEHIEAEIKSLDQAVTSLNSFRSGHLLDHEAEESKQREFTSYFDKHPGDRANI